ncbi:MAG: hypothetical protein DYH05_12935 [Acidobacteria bacterium ACB1]|nr:hypothetical protein [Pyrinomonadaceae bacterium]MCE7963385.1 hypothetical protein [Acidobacteria bacterium ACB1]RIJ94990.1 MAG: hypothetical protein DCC44_02830 [Acidobacteriota bacterium]
MKRNLRKLSIAAGRIGWTAFAALFVALGIQTAFAQSSDVNFPTPLSSNKLNGTIKARDIGDNRLTTHYFVFNGTQGDLFVNVVAKNLDADIDVFAADGLIPLTKMVVASDAQANETGRLIYLRKPEKLILRVQGRSPNDLPATYQISFGGGFAAITGQDAPDAPVVESAVSGEVAVNSVGTILPQQPKKEAARTEPPKAEIASTKEPVEAESKPVESDRREESKPSVEKAKTTPTTERRSKRRPKVVVTETIEPKAEVAAKPAKKKAEKRPRRTAKKEEKPEPPKAETVPPVDPLANVKLVILFKSGEKVEIGMPDLMKFTVDRGQLLVIRKTGSIDRYSMLDVAKVTIE